jgi:hypothetical protein
VGGEDAEGRREEEEEAAEKREEDGGEGDVGERTRGGRRVR